MVFTLFHLAHTSGIRTSEVLDMSDPKDTKSEFLDMELIVKLQVASVPELLAMVEAELRVFNELAEERMHRLATYQYKLKRVGVNAEYVQEDILKAGVEVQRSELVLDLQQRRIDIIDMALRSHLNILFEGNASVRGMVRKLRHTVTEELAGALASEGDPPLVRWGNEPTP